MPFTDVPGPRPAMAMGKPMAALVPMQVCSGTLHQVMKGTESVPPPMPHQAGHPADDPARAEHARRARHLARGLGLMFSSICAAT
jgi:hypothetical protein